MDNDDIFSIFGIPESSSDIFNQDFSESTFFSPLADFKEQHAHSATKADQATPRISIEEVQPSLPQNIPPIEMPTPSFLITSKTLNTLENEKSQKQKILDNALREAIEKRIPSLTSDLIKIGANPNCTYDNGFKPMFLCSKHEKLDCFEVLYANGACLDGRNTTGQTAFHAAICASNFLMMKRMNELEPNKFNILDTKDFSPKNTLNPLYIAILYDSINVLDFIFTKTPSNIIQSIITQCFPLHYAILYAKPKSVEALLKYVYVDQISKSGDTPLMLMARRKMKGNTPDIEARLDKIVDLLILHGANLHAASKLGNTAAQIAAKVNNHALANKLNQIAEQRNISFTISSSAKPGFQPNKKTMSLK